MGYTWKRDQLPIIPSKFIRKKSNRPFVQARNTILSSFYLIVYSCIDAFLAFENVNKLLNKFGNNGFDKIDLT